MPILLGACTVTPESPEVEVGPGQYQRAFAAARDLVREHRFPIDRVDAAAGVIASNPKQSSGIFTPWDTEQFTGAQELEDTINMQQRRVRVTFEPRVVPTAVPPDAQSPAAPSDLRGTSDALVCRFEVVVERIERPGRRVPAEAVRLGSQTMDPALRARGMWPTYAVDSVQDPLLAGRLATELRELLQKPLPEPEPAPPASP